MKLAKYIGDLLFEYECIVIPDFGGFITKSVPAEIQTIQNHFIPPKKEIVFNAHLKTNDGLLINHVAKAESLSYTDARIAVERFVNRCKKELNNGKRIRFQKVGLIYMGVENTLQFEADTSQNYLADSYGLTSFISPAIKRSSIRPIANKKVKKTRDAKYVVREEAKKQHSPKYIHINVSLVVILLAVASVFYFKYGTVKELYHNYASFIPFLDTTKQQTILPDSTLKINEPLANVITLIDRLNPAKGGRKGPEIKTNNKKSGTEIVTIEKASDAPSINSPEKKTLKTTPTKKEDNKERVIEEQTPDANRIIASNNPQYYIIAGSFGNKANAEKMMLKLRDKGFDSAIVGTNKYGAYRVSFNGFQSMDVANHQLAILREEENASAWILPN